MVIIGAGHAGGRAAEAMRGAGFTGEIVLIGEEDHVPYERPPLSKELLTGAGGAERDSRGRLGTRWAWGVGRWLVGRFIWGGRSLGGGAVGGRWVAGSSFCAIHSFVAALDLDVAPGLEGLQLSLAALAPRWKHR